MSATLILIVLDLLRLKNNPVAYLAWIGLEILVDFCGIFKEAYILGGPFVGCICVGISIRAIYENSIGGGAKQEYWWLDNSDTFVVNIHRMGERCGMRT